MAAIDDVLAKNKIIEYAERAEGIEDLVVICKKFLEKYKPEVFRPPAMSPYEYADFILKDYNRGNEIKMLQVSISIPETQYNLSGFNTFGAHEKLSIMLADEILKTQMIEFRDYKQPSTYDHIVTARIGVCKP